MTSSQQKRLGIIIFCLALVTMLVIYRLASFQIFRNEKLQDLRLSVQYQKIVDEPDRGIIYDRNMAVLASNSSDYQVSASPSLVTEPEETATYLAPILQKPRQEILNKLTSNEDYELIAGRVSPHVAEEIKILNNRGLEFESLARRIYPQGELMCHVLGYTDFNGEGGAGLEGYFQDDLAGKAASAIVHISPLSPQVSVIAIEGTDLVLTIDRTVQYLTEKHLENSLAKYQAQSGTIIVMDPRTGAILAMASKPCYSPYKFFEVYEENKELLENPAVGQQYEPGSVMKLITMAGAIDSGTVTPQTTYYDTGSIVLGGNALYNWDRSARGTVDMTGLLAHSLNVGAATIASWMGQDTYYHYLQRFNFGRATGIDLSGEESGLLPMPGDPNWTETNIGTNAFGQGLAVTPLQMISSASALANNGYQMQPYIVQKRIKEGEIIPHSPAVLSRPISEQTASQVSAMAINAVATEVTNAQVPGYTIAGKTGTAQIPEIGTYHPTDTIASFIGWLPADSPELIILIKIDRPQLSPWGSQVAAPTFSELASELVALLDIPPDRVRLQHDVIAVRGN